MNKATRYCPSCGNWLPDTLKDRYCPGCRLDIDEKESLCDEDEQEEKEGA
jgi:predicted amidophosphoribosyltransferase